MSSTHRRRGAVGAALVLAMVIGAAGSAWAQGPRGGRSWAGDGFGAGLPPLRMLAVALELTDAQQDQIRSILQGQRESMQEVGQRMRTARAGVDAAVRAPQVNEEAIRSAVGALAQVQGDAAVLRAKVRQDVLAQFTPEQRTKAEELEQSRRGWNRDRGARQGGQQRNR